MHISGSPICLIYGLPFPVNDKTSLYYFSHNPFSHNPFSHNPQNTISMNKLCSVVMAAVMLASASNAKAYDFASGQLFYNVLSETDGTVEVT